MLHFRQMESVGSAASAAKWHVSLCGCTHHNIQAASIFCRLYISDLNLYKPDVKGLWDTRCQKHIFKVFRALPGWVTDSGQWIKTACSMRLFLPLSDMAGGL